MAMMLNETIPTARRTFDPNKRNPNAVELTTHVARAARIAKFSKVFYEKNVGTEEQPRYEEARETDANAIPRLRVYVTFDKVKNLDGQPLTLSTKMRASLAPRATLAILVAGLAGITPEDVKNANLDLETFYGAPVTVNTKKGRNNNAMLTTIVAAPREEDDENPVATTAAAETTSFTMTDEDVADFFAA